MRSADQIETMPGTRDVGERLARADLAFVALVAEAGFTQTEAWQIFHVYRKHRCIRREGTSRWVVKHGGFWDKDALNRALALAVNADA